MEPQNSQIPQQLPVQPTPPQPGPPAPQPIQPGQPVQIPPELQQYYPQQPSNGGSHARMWRLIALIVIVLIIIFGGLWVCRRVSNHHVNLETQPKANQVIQSPQSNTAPHSNTSKPAQTPSANSTNGQSVRPTP